MSQPSDDISIKPMVTLENARAVGTFLGQLVRVGVLEPGNLQWERVVGPRRLGYPIACGKDLAIPNEITEICDVIDEAFQTEASR